MAAISSTLRRALDASGVRLSRVTLLGSGYGSTAYRLHARAGDLVLRVPKPPFAWSVPTLERECALLAALEGVDFGIAIPRGMRALRDDSDALVATVHSFVEGAGLKHPRRGAAREGLCADLGRFLSALHAVPAEVATDAGVPSVDLWAERYRGLIDEALPSLPPASRRWLATLGEEFGRIGTRAAPRVLTHGDIQGGNLLVDAEGTLTGIIDFGNAAVADPALDFAGVLNDLGWRDLERVWAHYDGLVDADVERRVRFYMAVEPIYMVLYGEAAEGPAERATGVRKFAARAAAASRATSRARA